MTQPQRVVPPVKTVAGYQRLMKGWYHSQSAIISIYK